MKEINIAEADVAAVARQLEQVAHEIPRTAAPVSVRFPAVLVIDCVLSLNRRYDSFVVPRLNTFVERHPEIRQIGELENLMASCPTPHAFVQQELNYNHEARANTLAFVVKYVCTIVEEAQTVEEEKEALKRWAIESKPQECYSLKIKGFKLAGFQYLRKLFGADTTKPDIYIKRFISDILNRNVSDIESLHLLEAASERVGISVRDVDSYIWNRGARSETR